MINVNELYLEVKGKWKSLYPIYFDSTKTIAEGNDDIDIRPKTVKGDVHIKPKNIITGNGSGIVTSTKHFGATQDVLQRLLQRRQAQSRAGQRSKPAFEERYVQQ
jgi:hypothetical protein